MNRWTVECFEMERWKQKTVTSFYPQTQAAKVNHMTWEGLAGPPPCLCTVLSKMKARINRKYYQWMSQRRLNIFIIDILLQESTVSNCCRGPSSLHLYCCLYFILLTQLNIIGAKQIKRKITFLFLFFCPLYICFSLIFISPIHSFSCKLPLCPVIPVI